MQTRTVNTIETVLSCLPFSLSHSTIFIFPIDSFGQINVNFKKKIINQTNTRANQAADKTISKGLDAVEDGVTDAIKGEDDKEKDQPDNSSSSGNAQSDSGNKSGETAAGKSQAQEQPALQTYSKYDFIPGEKVILFEDFAQDAVGDFPALWNTNATGEIIGVVFDGNYEAMISDWQYDYDIQRTISVDIRYVMFILEKFSKADYLLKEMGVN